MLRVLDEFHPRVGQGDLSGAFDVCSLEELQQLGGLSRTFRHPERGLHDVGIFWDGEAAYALDDWCPHADAFLHAGDIRRRRVACPLHHAVFDLQSGQCLDGYTFDVRAYRTQVRNGRVWVHLPDEEPVRRGSIR